MKRLEITQFGNPVLRSRAVQVTDDRINSDDFQNLIVCMQNLLHIKKLGIGLAAPQVGVSLAVAVIVIQETPLRGAEDKLSQVIINPKITQVFGRKSQMWEGCISSGAGAAGLFAKVPRFRKIELEFLDENAVKHTKIFDGLVAHVVQHEVDHLQGILFVDKVKDTKTYMTYAEYKKMKRKTDFRKI